MKNILENLFGSQSPIGDVVTMDAFAKEDAFENVSNISLIEAVRYNTEGITNRIDRELQVIELRRTKLLLHKRLHMAMYDALCKVDTEID